ncbi:MAG: hypothetical protein GY905_14960 [Gammaproteobacteria bacterium]|nr:hypothetical protein [Gammaproteobacteria bacterium]
MSEKPNEIKKEIDQLSTEEARQWCRVLRLDWITYDKSRSYGTRTWVQLIQERANADY